MYAYFDNSATTAVCPEAIDAVNYCMRECWANPSSLHELGMQADALLEKSRESIAKRLSCQPDEIIFTSGGTESNNIALIGAAHAMKRNGKKIVSTSVEHPSVDETLSRLEAEGFEVVRLRVDSYGRINERELFNAVDRNTILVSIMAVNNEVGTVQPFEAAKKAVIAARSPALVHCDAVQAFGKIPLKPARSGIDLMSISSHKIHGPKGVGALYIRKGVKLSPRVFGGAQERQIRPGTQPMPAIAGFAAAADALPNPADELRSAAILRDYLVSRLSEIEGIALNSPSDALPYITSISVIGRKSEPMLNYLSSKGICVSAGSACSKGKKSKVLTAMGLSPERLDGPLRISFSRFTTVEEIDALVLCLSEARKAVRGIK